MNVADVLDEIKKLSPSEKRQIVETLLRETEAEKEAGLEERQAEFLEQLLAEGVIKNIPMRRVEDWDFEPVPIKGAPLSETIIEERR
jgi:hypothetical protein